MILHTCMRFQDLDSTACLNKSQYVALQLPVVSEVTEEAPEETVTIEVTPKPKEEAPEKETLEIIFAPEEAPKPETVEITFAPTEEAPTEIATVEVTKVVKKEGIWFSMDCIHRMDTHPFIYN